MNEWPHKTCIKKKNGAKPTTTDGLAPTNFNLSVCKSPSRVLWFWVCSWNHGWRVYSPGIPLALLKRERRESLALQTRKYRYCVYLEPMYIYIYTMKRGLTINPFPESPSAPYPSTRAPKNSFNKKNSFHLFAILCSHLVHLPIRYFPELSPGVSIHLSIYEGLGGRGGVFWGGEKY